MADLNYNDIRGQYITAYGDGLAIGTLVKAVSTMNGAPIVDVAVDDGDVFVGVVTGKEPSAVPFNEGETIDVYTVQVSGYAVTEAGLDVGWHNVAFKDGALDDTGDGSGRGITVVNGANGKIAFIF